LNCRHHVILLREERVSEIRCPLNVVGEFCDHIRKRSQTLNACIPWLLGYGIRQGLILQAGVLPDPLLKLNEFDWVGGSNQRLA
jgi:hypothetical protein